MDEKSELYDRLFGPPNGRRLARLVIGLVTVAIIVVLLGLTAIVVKAQEGECDHQVELDGQKVAVYLEPACVGTDAEAMILLELVRLAEDGQFTPGTVSDVCTMEMGAVSRAGYFEITYDSCTLWQVLDAVFTAMPPVELGVYVVPQRLDENFRCEMSGIEATALVDLPFAIEPEQRVTVVYTKGSAVRVIGRNWGQGEGGYLFVCNRDGSRSGWVPDLSTDLSQEDYGGLPVVGMLIRIQPGAVFFWDVPDVSPYTFRTTVTGTEQLFILGSFEVRGNVWLLTRYDDRLGWINAESLVTGQDYTVVPRVTFTEVYGTICNNGLAEPGETCANCSADAGQCPTVTPEG